MPKHPLIALKCVENSTGFNVKKEFTSLVTYNHICLDGKDRNEYVNFNMKGQEKFFFLETFWSMAEFLEVTKNDSLSDEVFVFLFCVWLEFTNGQSGAKWSF